jgi:omega-amidase
MLKMAASTVRVALCQIMAGADKQANLDTAVAAIAEAASHGAKLIALPECFNR